MMGTFERLRCNLEFGNVVEIPLLSDVIDADLKTAVYLPTKAIFHHLQGV